MQAYMNSVIRSDFEIALRALRQGDIENAAFWLRQGLADANRARSNAGRAFALRQLHKLRLVERAIAQHEIMHAAIQHMESRRA